MNSDFKDLLAVFNAHTVEYLVVGGYAVAAHGHIRSTKDLDLWVRPDIINAERAFRAIQEFGAPLHDLVIEDLARPGLIFQIGIPPVRIDIITRVAGIDFASAWADRAEAKFDELTVPVLSRRHLIINKRAVGRHQELADVEHLEALDQEEPEV